MVAITPLVLTRPAATNNNTFFSQQQALKSQKQPELKTKRNSFLKKKRVSFSQYNLPRSLKFTFSTSKSSMSQHLEYIPNWARSLQSDKANTTNFTVPLSLHSTPNHLRYLLRFENDILQFLTSDPVAETTIEDLAAMAMRSERLREEEKENVEPNREEKTPAKIGNLVLKSHKSRKGKSAAKAAGKPTPKASAMSSPYSGAKSKVSPKVSPKPKSSIPEIRNSTLETGPSLIVTVRLGSAVKAATHRGKPRAQRKSRSRSGCWTCRLRHKACPEDGDPCGLCVRLRMPCDYSAVKPAYMSDKKLASARLKFIRTSGERRGRKLAH